MVIYGTTEKTVEIGSGENPFCMYFNDCHLFRKDIGSPPRHEHKCLISSTLIHMMVLGGLKLSSQVQFSC